MAVMSEQDFDEALIAAAFRLAAEVAAGLGSASRPRRGRPSLPLAEGAGAVPGQARAASAVSAGCSDQAALASRIG